MTHQKKSNLLRNLLALAFVLLAGSAAAAYAFDWLNIHNSPTSTSIEIETGEMRATAQEAAERGEELVEQAGEFITETVSMSDEPAGDNTPDSTTDQPSDAATNG